MRSVPLLVSMQIRLRRGCKFMNLIPVGPISRAFIYIESLFLNSCATILYDVIASEI